MPALPKHQDMNCRHEYEILKLENSERVYLELHIFTSRYNFHVFEMKKEKSLLERARRVNWISSRRWLNLTLIKESCLWTGKSIVSRKMLWDMADGDMRQSLSVLDHYWLFFQFLFFQFAFISFLQFISGKLLGDKFHAISIRFYRRRKIIYPQINRYRPFFHPFFGCERGQISIKHAKGLFIDILTYRVALCV